MSAPAAARPPVAPRPSRATLKSAMRAFILYRPHSEQGRVVEEYVRDFNRGRQAQLDLVNVETRDGTATAMLYDIMQYPAILVVRDDGQLVKDWQGDQLPLMNEVMSYLGSGGDSINFLLKPSHGF